MAEKRIEQLIKDDKLADAYANFFEFLKRCSNLEDELIVGNSRLTQLTQQELLGVLNDPDSPEKNKIRVSLVSQMRQFRKDVLSVYFDDRGFVQQMMNMTDRDQFLNEVLEARLLVKKFVILEKLTGGNSSINYSILNEERNMYAVAQVLRQDAIEEDTRAEFRKMAGLKHRNLAKIYDLELNAYPFFIIKEYIHGYTIKDLIQKVGPRSRAQVTDWLYQLTDALIYLRQKRIFHTNVRPSKVFIDDEWHPMFTPLDLSAITQKNITYDRFLDVCRYGSPQLLRTFNPKDASTSASSDNWSTYNSEDQYALGVLGFYVLTGQELFKGETVSDIMAFRKQFDEDDHFRNIQLAALDLKPAPSVGNKANDLTTIIRRLLNPEATDRYPTLHALLRALHALTHFDDLSGGIAQNSYRRCLANNREFTKDFYAAFFAKAPHAREQFSLLGEKRQLSVLQMAIDIILDIENRQDELVGKILDNEHHKGITKADYATFLDVLIDNVAQCDPDYDETVSDSWQTVRNQFLLHLS